MNRVADQPKELQDWTPDRQCKWFANEFEKILPVTLTKDEGLIPVSKVMQINKVVHPRLNTEYLEHRRQLYIAKDWAAYDKCVKDSF